MMQSPHYRKIELQSPADLTYLYTNTVALSRQKLDLHFPPSAYSDGDNPDPMKERVKQLVDQFIRQTYTHASNSISINGLEYDSTTANNNSSAAENGEPPFLSAFSAPETVEYEAYDSNLAARVSSLYAQLESLTTTVAQLRRDAPGKAAKNFADVLNEALAKDDDDDAVETAAITKNKNNNDNHKTSSSTNNNTRQRQQNHKERKQPDQKAHRHDDVDDSKMDIDNDDDKELEYEIDLTTIKPEWKLDIPLGTAAEHERWYSGEMAEVYTDTLRTLLRLQGEGEGAGADDANNKNGDGYDYDDDNDDNNNSSNSYGKKAISTTVATAERAERAVEFVEKM